jgi:Fur family ferric uptake transcriptional regulator
MAISDPPAPTTPVAIKIRQALEEHTRRRTRPRNRISLRLAELAASGATFTVEELWRDLKQLDRHLGRTTVFRAVEMLGQQGLLNRVEFADGHHAYRACGDQHHHHLTCVHCRRVVDVDICLPTTVLAEVGKQTGFTVEGHSLDLFGECPECRRLPLD